MAAGLLILAGCLPTGIAIFYFWMHGALQPFLDANIGSNIAYINIMLPLRAVMRFSASGLAPIMGCVIMVSYALMRCEPWRRTWASTSSPQAWVLLWCIATVINVCLPMKFFSHYYFALYPPLCIAGAHALSVAAGNRRNRFAAGLIVLFSSAIPLWVTGEVRAASVARTDVPRQAAEFLRQAGARDRKVFVYDYEPIIYALARVRPPMPYVLGVELTEFTHSSKVDGVAEVRHVMDSSPDFVVLRVRAPGEEVGVFDDLIAHRLAAYHLVDEIKRKADSLVVRIYRR
jgi:hypothetical protein